MNMHVPKIQQEQLESANFGVAFASGMAAIDAICKLLQPGDEVIASDDLYGGSYRIFTKVFQPYGINFHFTDMRNSDAVAALINDKTKMLWIETPTNPMLNIVDISDMVDITAGKNIMVVVDNTFASPYLQRPIELGAHMVIHSSTKYVGGHSDVVSGMVCVNDEAVKEQLEFIQNSCGAVPGPQDCFLCLRGIKTLAVRMDRHCANARQIAELLSDHSAVEKVIYPGFTDHPGHNVALRQMKGFGGMVSFSLKNDSLEAAVALMSKTKLFTLAESLGGVESLIGHPASMTHASIPIEERRKTGVVDSLIRLSVGIEDLDDLKEDLLQAIG